MQDGLSLAGSGGKGDRLSRLTADDLRAEIRRLGPWHHDIEIVSGIRTGEVAAAEHYRPELGTPMLTDPDRILSKTVRALFQNGLEGRSFLDCACNAGGYVFTAMRHGAGRAFGFDAREHWIAQARFLSRHLPGEGASFEVRKLDELPELGLEPFDITHFGGILYHLPDPVAGLRIAADHTRELLIVNTATSRKSGKSLQLNRESDTHLMSGIDRLAWLPTVDVLPEILAWCGFPHTRLSLRYPLPNGRVRIELLAARQPETFAHFDSVRIPSAGSLVGRLRRFWRKP